MIQGQWRLYLFRNAANTRTLWPQSRRKILSGESTSLCMEGNAAGWNWGGQEKKQNLGNVADIAITEIGVWSLCPTADSIRFEILMNWRGPNVRLPFSLVLKLSNPPRPSFCKREPVEIWRIMSSLFISTWEMKPEFLYALLPSDDIELEPELPIGGPLDTPDQSCISLMSALASWMHYFPFFCRDLGSISLLFFGFVFSPLQSFSLF